MTVDKVKVAVRVRPFNRREIELKTQSVIEMEANSTVLRIPSGSSNSPPSSDQASDQSSRKSAKSFSFDHCFDSMNKTTGATQEQVFDSLGDYILDDAFKGYNACIFAYGQTGSGKSYTMMGSQDDPGLIPRLSVELFERIIKSNDQANETKAEVSYMEIYNEKVHDLLDPLSGKKGGLRVREHSVLGPYVDGLSQLVVSNYKDIEVLMEEGNKSRTVAATNMNNESSRSHAVFTIILTSRLTDLASGVTGERVSRISLVDLAGSERALKTGAVGQRLKEGSNINKSLTTLGLVISKLAETNQGNKNKDKFIPYRDSALTWLLKDCLGGNSRTVMIATISPAGDNYQETLSTLRYADRAKRIVNNAVVNEDPNAKVIRELRSEIEALKEMLIHSADPRLLKEKLGENEKLMKEVSLTWQEKMDKTEQIQEDRRQAMEKMGISIQSSGIKVEKDRYFLVNLNSDPSMNELLVYYLNPDVTLVGREDASITQNIQLSGLGISSEHCKISVEEGIPYIDPVTDAKTCINGREIQSKSILRDGDRILWGCNHLFRLNCPKLRGLLSEDSAIIGNPVEDNVGNHGGSENGAKIESSDHGGSVDWMMAQEEVLMRGTGNHVDIVKRFESEKEAALEEQRKDYENKIENLKQALAMQQDFELRVGENGSPALMSSSFIEDENEDDLQQTENWAMGLSKLREDIVLANMLIREANLLAAELGKSTTFSSTLRIPPQNLTPNRYHGGFLAEPAILVRQGESGQMATWSLQKMDSKIILMRDMYKRKISGMTRSDDDINSEEDYIDEGVEDPFHEVAQNHDLIGVANLYLESLFHKVHYEYCIPLISAQGEVSGRLKVELEKVEGSLPEDRFGGADDSSSEELSHLSGDSGHSSTTTDLRLQGSNSTTPPHHVIMRGGQHNHQDNSIKFRMKISELRGIAPVFSDFVFCEFSIDGGESHLVLPKMTTQVSRDGSKASSIPKSTMSGTVQFQYENIFTIPITEEFVDLCTDGAVAIHVYSKRMDSYTQDGSGGLDRTVTTLEDTWDMVTRRIQLDMQILELNDQGEYTPVEIQGEEGDGGSKGGKNLPHTGKELLRGGTGGTFQIRQGQQKRLKFKVAVLQNTGSGSLPLDIAGVSSIAVGAEVLRGGSCKSAAGCPSAASLPLDSYQEDDLNYLREAWSQALHHRKLHLQTQIQAFMDLENKSDEEKSREDSLIDQLVQLMEEQNATYSPPDNTSIPGSMISGSVEAGLEKYHPVLYFNSEQIRNQIKVQDEMYVPLVGEDSIISKELGSEFIELPLVNQCIEAGICEAAWDTSLHTSDLLNKVTEASQRVYMIARLTVRLAQPFTMDIVLRKRFSVTVMPNRQSLTNRIWKKLATSSNIVSVGVIYQLVDRLPTTSAELENRESLATVAASGREILAQDGESLIEKYSKGISSVNEILRTDRISQQIVLKELLTKQRKMFGQMPSRTSSILLGGGGGMRKTISVPNMKYFRTSLSNDNLASSSGHHPLAGTSTMMRMSDSFHEGCTITPSNNLLSNSNSNNQLSFGGNRKMRQSFGGDEQQRGIPVRRMTSSKTMTTLHEESLGHHTTAENDNTAKHVGEQVIQKCDSNKHLEDNEKAGLEETSNSQLESNNLEHETIQR